MTEEMLVELERQADFARRTGDNGYPEGDIDMLVEEVRRLRAAGRCGSCRFMAAQREDDNARFGEYDSDAFEWKPSPHSTCVRIVHGNGGQKKGFV